MNATLLELPVETRGTPVSCENCPALQRLERALTQLQRDFRREVGYWRSRHADAVKRIEQLKDELDQAQGQIRSLQAKLFGRKSEKSACRDRSNVLFDPEDTSAAAKKRGADSTSAVSPDVRLRSRAANAGGPAAAEADPQGQLRHLDLGACVVG